jgi:predicted CoA-binding protein
MENGGGSQLVGLVFAFTGPHARAAVDGPARLGAGEPARVAGGGGGPGDDGPGSGHAGELLVHRQALCQTPAKDREARAVASDYETFWENSSFAVVGHAARKNFPRLTYRALKQQGKVVYPVDPSADEIEGDRAYKDLQALPGKVDAVVLEVPKEETRDWVARAAEAGIKNVWIHMARETPEALALAKEKGLNARSGTCAVMYLTPGFTYHSIHKWIMKLMGKY